MPTLTGTRIIKFQAENFKKLRAVEITPDGNVIEVRGKNAQGKTSVLDAIWHALSYTAAKKGTTKPIREGETAATVTLEFEGFIVTRTWTDNDKPASLKITSHDGLSYSSPQKLLDEVIGSLSFDPLAFANAAPKDQLKTLLSVVELPFDPEELQAKKDETFTHRTSVNRRVKELEAQVAGMAVPPADLPLSEVSSADVLAELREGQQHNERIDTVMRHLAAAEAASTQLGNIDGSPAIGLIRQAVEVLPELVNIDQFQVKLSGLEGTNAQIRMGIARAEATKALEHFQSEAAGLTATIDAYDVQKSEAMKAAKLPVDGLGFDEEGVTYLGVPFSQASGAEQLRVSMAMAMSLNPGVRILRITDATLLDSTNRALVDQMAEEHDFQIWLEVVSEDGSVGVLIDDGSVVNS